MINWGIIGCGGIARRRMIPELPKCRHSRVAAVMDTNRPAAVEVAAPLGARVYDREADLLADPEVKAVYIATPVYLHHRQTLLAASAGKHVLVEKPLALTVGDGEAMVQACRRAGVGLCEGYMMKYHPLHEKARDMVRRGELGSIVFSRAQLSCWYPDLPGAWRQDPALSGGGSLIDMATHCYDLLQHLVGHAIREVVAFTDTLAFQYPVEDSSTTLLRFANGSHGVVDSFFNIPDAAGHNRLEIYGTRGSLLAEGTIGQTATGTLTTCIDGAGRGYDSLQNRTGQDMKVRAFQAEPADLYARELDAMSSCIERGQGPSLNTGEEGIRILRIVEAAYRSNRTGQKVVLV